MKRPRSISRLLLGCMLMFPAYGLAQSPPVKKDTKPVKKAATKKPVKKKAEEPKLGPIRLRPIVIYQTPNDLSRVGGSAHRLGKKLLKVLQYDAPDQILAAVPGVYVRQEDGYGLRPNIGLRGANSDRSKKVTLMEDGILFGPAPYSAPAAYYFPLMLRLTGLDVIKGPAAILYGPQTIGGAVNFFTRDIPRRGHKGFFDLAYGHHNYLKLHGVHGWGGSRGGLLIEAAHLMTDGFKRLDTGGNTGFMKQEVMVKGRLTSDPLSDVFHRWDIKLGFSHEQSNETYLGLTDADFRADPYRRYAASALDQMNLMRLAVDTSYTLQVGEDFDFAAAFYTHWLRRSWFKANRFKGGPSLSAILKSPDSGIRKVFYDVITGAQDSASDDETLMLGDNLRHFLVLGGQLTARYRLKTGPITHEIRTGLRYHFDEIKRNHTEDGYVMVGGMLEPDGGETTTTVLNHGSAGALAGYLQYALHGWRLTLQPGLRFERVVTALHDQKLDTRTEATNTTLMPGIGAHFEIVKGLGIFAGVYQGFSPVAPGQSEEVSPELSLNYEFGLRYLRKKSGTRLEAIGFFNDYTNLVGQCSFSSGCAPEEISKQFNGGEVDIFGLELVAAHTFRLPADIKLGLRAAYTLTQSEFKSAFVSKNPQFGAVEVGYELPYVPDHQLSFQLQLAARKWGVGINLSFLDKMREVAGQGEGEPTDWTDAFTMLDVSAQYRPLKWLEVYLKGENLLMAKPVVARRPYGARPTKPLLITGGVKASW